MINKNNTTCKICGRPYHMCISCKDSIKSKPWQAHTCSSEHYKIYQVLYGVRTNIYTKAEAKDKLKNVDLSDLESFKDSIKTIIKDIMSVEDVKNNVVEIVEETIEETKSVKEEQIIEPEIVEEIPVFNKYKSNRKNDK